MNNHPIVRVRAEHNISRRDIDPDALKVLYRLVRAGHTAYLVGGGVRDLLLGRKPKDFDISTDANPKQIQRIFGNCILIGRRFRLAHIKYGNKIIETSTFRGTPAPINGELLQTDDNVFGTPAEDSLRRDFTINGLFYCVESFTVIDYVGGLDDLAARSLRTIGDPHVRFQEDPIRMLRAIRFAARLNFTIEAATYNAIITHKAIIHQASKPRLLEEIYRLFYYRGAANAMRLLWQTGMLAEILPTIDAHLRGVADADNASLWQYLTAADNAQLANDAPELFLAAAYFPLLVEKLPLPIAKAGQRDLLKAYEEVMMPFLDFYGTPRRTRDFLRLLIGNQPRFFTNPHKQNIKRLRVMSQTWFPAALQLFKVINTAIGGAAETVDKWQEVYENYQKNPIGRATGRHSPADNQATTNIAPNENNLPPLKPRRRRRRGGRRRPPQSHPADNGSTP